MTENALVKLNMSAGLVPMKCPICNKKVMWEGNPFRPFCSQRCQIIDLGNWASEKYCMPDRNEKPEEDPAAEEEPSDEL
jgi:endogenous inhibitor of DNA gyrase (YacG/DUF329 family)